MEDVFVEFLLKEVANGKRADNSFKAKTWQDAVPVINAKLPEGWLTLTAKKIQQKYDNMKKDFDIYETLLNQSGFGFNPDTQATDVDEGTWKEYVAAHPKASKFRRKGTRQPGTYAGV
jgi:hypothetical protein